MTRKKGLSILHMDQEVRSYMEQLMDDHDTLQMNNSDMNEGEQNDGSGASKIRNVRGPTLLKDIWNMPPGTKINVRFNHRNQAVGREARKLASFLGIVARTPELTPFNFHDWRFFPDDDQKKLLAFVKKKFTIPPCGENFVLKSIGRKWKDHKCDLKTEYMTKYKTKDALLKHRPNRIPRDQWTSLVSYWVSEPAKKRSQANRINRAKQKTAHTSGSKSFASLIDEKTKDGIEPTRAEIYIETHKKRKDGRPLDEESARRVELIKEKLSNESIEESIERPSGSVAWEGDAYSQVMGPERSGYVRGLGLGPTPSSLWGKKYTIGNINLDQSSHETIKKLEEEVQGLKEKHAEEMNMMKQNQEKLLSELTFMRSILNRFFPAEYMPPTSRRSSEGQVLDATSGDHSNGSS